MEELRKTNSSLGKKNIESWRNSRELFSFFIFLATAGTVAWMSLFQQNGQQSSNIHRRAVGRVPGNKIKKTFSFFSLPFVYLFGLSCGIFFFLEWEVKSCQFNIRSNFMVWPLVDTDFFFVIFYSRRFYRTQTVTLKRIKFVVVAPKTHYIVLI